MYSCLLDYPMKVWPNCYCCCTQAKEKAPVTMKCCSTWRGRRNGKGRRTALDLTLCWASQAAWWWLWRCKAKDSRRLCLALQTVFIFTLFAYTALCTLTAFVPLKNKHLTIECLFQCSYWGEVVKVTQVTELRALIHETYHSSSLLKQSINAALMSAPSGMPRSGTTWATGCLCVHVCSSDSSALKWSPCSSQMLCSTQEVSTIFLVSSSLQSFLFKMHLHHPFNLPKDISTTDRALLSL